MYELVLLTFKHTAAITHPVTSNVTCITNPVTSNVTCITNPVTSNVTCITNPVTSNVTCITNPVTSNVTYRVRMNVTAVTMMSGGMDGKTTVMITAQGVEEHGGYRCIELVRVKLKAYCPCVGGGGVILANLSIPSLNFGSYKLFF